MDAITTPPVRSPRPTGRSRARGFAALAGAVGLAFASFAGTAVTAGASDPGTSSTTIVGSVPSIPHGARSRGTLPGSTPVHLVVTLKPRNPAALRSAVRAVSTPGSPLYRKYVSPESFGTTFGATDAQLATVRSGLKAEGLTPGTVASNRLSMTVDAPASAVATALHTPIRSYNIAGGGTAYANTVAPTLPSSLAENVQGVLGLDTFPAAHPLSHTAKRSATSTTKSAATSSTACSAAANVAAETNGATPSDFLNAYSASSLVSAGHTGQGQDIAIMSLQQVSNSDVTTFRQCFGSTGAVKRIAIDGGSDPSDGTDEATLDVETLLGLAPAAHISVYEAPNSNTGWYDGLAAIIGTNSAKSISISWGLCEDESYDATVQAGDGYLLDAEFDLLAQAAMQGQSVFAATGDSGSADCAPDSDELGVDDPASQPFVTAVGGTSLLNTTAPPNETVWNNSYGASGGGISFIWSQPFYQAGITDGYDRNGDVCGNQGDYCRTVPDVAASADPDNHALVVFTDGEWDPIGGTSLAAPTWAALVADMNSSCPATNGFGLLNGTLYTLPSTDFNDVTTGNNDNVGTNGGKYAAKTGYDLATGLGTPVISHMTSALCAKTSTITPNESFIFAAYVDFTGGIPWDDDTDPIDYWDDQLENGRSRSAFIAALANSDAWVAHIVQDFYQDTLGRAPDSGGLGYWESIIESGRMSVAQVAAQFYSSSEYFRRDGNSARTWVTDLYNKLLERSATSSDVNFWVNQVAVKGRAWVALSFYQSNESRMDRVANLYQQLLHRAPDHAGQVYWAGQITTKGDIALAENLAVSSEYYRLAAVRFPGP